MESEERRPVFTKRLILTILVIILIILIILLLLKKCGNGRGYSVVGITAQPTVLNLAVGESQKIYAQVEPSDATNQGYTCRSMNLTVATVDESCTVTGVGDGTTTILVISDDGGKTTEVTVNVGAQVPELTGIKLDPKKYTVNVGRSKLVTVIAIPEGAKLPELSYAVTDPTVAKVNSLGKIEGLKVGTTTLTVSTLDGKYSDTATIYVVKRSNQPTTCPSGQVLEGGVCVPVTVKPTGITLGTTSKTIKVGESFKPSVTITPSGASQAITCTVATDGQKFLGENNCKLTGLAVGKAKVTVCSAADKNICADMEVTITAKDPESIMFTNGTTIKIYVGQSYKLKSPNDYRIDPTGASQAITCTVTSGGSYVTQSSCTLTGVAKGNAVVKVCTKANSKICANLAVQVLAEAPTKITLKDKTKEIYVGDTYKPTATITPSGASQDITCTVKDTKILSENKCTLTGLKAGKTTVTVCAKGTNICADMEITVKEKGNGGNTDPTPTPTPTPDDDGGNGGSGGNGGNTSTGTRYTLTYNCNGGTGGGTDSCTTTVSGGTCTVTLGSVQCTRSGYHFNGWSTSTVATNGNTAGTPITLKGNTTVYAVWTKTEKADAVITCRPQKYTGSQVEIATCSGGTISNADRYKTNAGTYTVKCTGDAYHNDATARCTLAQADTTITCKNPTYTGGNLTIATCSVGNIQGGIQKSAGKWNVICEGDANHKAAQGSCEIKKATAKITCKSPKYTGSAVTVATCTGVDGTSKNFSGTNVGSYNVTCNLANHNTASSTCQVISQDKPTCTTSFVSPDKVQVSGYPKTFNGKSVSSITINGTTATTVSAAGTYTGKVSYADGTTITCSSVAVKKFTLSYSCNGGTGSVASQTCMTSGASCSVELLGGASCKRTGYSFTGWNLGAVGASVTLTANKTAKATWVDNIPPSISCTCGNSGTTSGVSITCTATDAGSGLSTTQRNWTNRKADVTASFTDNAGNTKSKTVTVTAKSVSSGYACPSGYSYMPEIGGLCYKNLGASTTVYSAWNCGYTNAKTCTASSNNYKTVECTSVGPYNCGDSSYHGSCYQVKTCTRTSSLRCTSGIAYQTNCYASASHVQQYTTKYYCP